MKQERLLTEIEIKEIEEFVRNNKWLCNPQIINPGRDNITSVHKVSPEKGLIFIYGNAHTGLHHIESRHTVRYGTPFRINDDTKRNPSQFNENYIPIIHYPTIAEHIYDPSNKDVEKNSRPELFDVYYGEYTDLDNYTEYYKLVLYKDTKIVHTFHPKTARRNRDIVKSFNFRRGASSCTHNIIQCTVKITLPYLNKANKINYSVEFNLDGVAKTEEIILWIHDKNENHEMYSVISKTQFNGLLPTFHYAVYLEHADLRVIERLIKKIDENTKPTPEH
jgi:hypothetical protein